MGLGKEEWLFCRGFSGFYKEIWEAIVVVGNELKKELIETWWDVL